MEMVLLCPQHVQRTQNKRMDTIGEGTSGRVRSRSGRDGSLHDGPVEEGNSTNYPTVRCICQSPWSHVLWTVRRHPIGPGSRTRHRPIAGVACGSQSCIGRAPHQYPLLRHHRHQSRRRGHVHLRRCRQTQDRILLRSTGRRIRQLRRRKRLRGLPPRLLELSNRTSRLAGFVHAAIPTRRAASEGDMREVRRAVRTGKCLRSTAKDRGYYGGEDDHEIFSDGI
mmetsp:Transcript_16216/g.34238  ORF Transcript_16216/g.34238 Transcript_16216/m.34238 type:complete len:224 (+) Transcript_16216:781-1452(+)